MQNSTFSENADNEVVTNIQGTPQPLRIGVVAPMSITSTTTTNQGSDDQISEGTEENAQNATLEITANPQTEPGHQSGKVEIKAVFNQINLFLTFFSFTTFFIFLL